MDNICILWGTPYEDHILSPATRLWQYMVNNFSIKNKTKKPQKYDGPNSQRCALFYSRSYRFICCKLYRCIDYMDSIYVIKLSASELRFSLITCTSAFTLTSVLVWNSYTHLLHRLDQFIQTWHKVFLQCTRRGFYLNF